ncbi:MAG: metal ABC transporter permease [Deltaproteobacteria bacterium]|nr:metal ABC transporter permease [Deltaproteobacteria bacterium]MCB9479153.1 metal ABC transporter permease [Deltaproteobacteria bacterium]MCB9489176.1 metal ABC transporter permease [Deltaproteobacteria bacterium]
MTSLYDAIAELARGGYLPGMFEHAFMIRGLIAALIIGPVLGGMGTLVVTKKLSFFTQTVGHASLTGVALGLLFGEPIDGTYAGLYGFCLIMALLMTWVKRRTRFSSDTVIGVVLAQILGLGIVLLVAVTKQFNIHQVEAILFGSLITLSDKDIAVLAVTAVVASIVAYRLFNRTMLVSFNPVLAKARGIPEVWVEYLFITVMTAVVVASLKLIGALLVLVLIVVPAAGAQNIAGNLRQFFYLSMVFSTASTLLGLVLSGVWPVPTGGAIVLVGAVIFYATLILRQLTGRAGARQGEL